MKICHCGKQVKAPRYRHCSKACMDKRQREIMAVYMKRLRVDKRPQSVTCKKCSTVFDYDGKFRHCVDCRQVRGPHTKNCAYCEQPFIYGRNKYCQSKCAVLAHREQQAKWQRGYYRRLVLNGSNSRQVASEKIVTS